MGPSRRRKTNNSLTCSSAAAAKPLDAAELLRMSVATSPPDWRRTTEESIFEWCVREKERKRVNERKKSVRSTKKVRRKKIIFRKKIDLQKEKTPICDLFSPSSLHPLFNCPQLQAAMALVLSL